MNKLILLALITCLVIALAACGEATPEPAAATIKPGDEIDGMTFTTLKEYFFTNDLNQYCDLENPTETDTGATEIECLATAGDQVFFGNCAGVGGDSPEELESAWSEHKAEVAFDGQALELPSFGSIDSEFEGTYIRMWNLALEGITPGTHTIHCLMEAGDSWDAKFTFTVADQYADYPGLSGAVTPGQHAYTSEDGGPDFLLYVPESYGQDPGRTWPLILYLHGYPTGLEHLEWIARDGLAKLLASEVDFPAIVVSPHRDEGLEEYWFQEENVLPLFGLLAEVQDHLTIDQQRIYLAGTSAGGNGVWEFGLQYPHRFAALVPVAGYYGWPFTVPDNICDLKDTPVWAFHGQQDERIPLEAEQSLVDALAECGGDARITVFPDTFHNIDERLVYTEELLSWLFAHTLDENS
jgi:pimeloyl-ACP methyl ester carboxylesterase